MTTILVPYHQDEPLPPDTIPLREPTVTVRPDLPEGALWPRLNALHAAVADAVAAHDQPTVLSGDCLVTLGVLAGLQRAGIDAAVIWFDAHGDVHTLESSTSGYLGGMALRLVLGAHADLAAEPLGLRPLPEGRAVLVDARDLDPAEADFLAGARVRRVGVGDLADLPDGPLLLHIDVDVIDAAELPGLLFPVPNGPSTDAVLTAARQVAATGRVAATHLSLPWHPPTENDGPIRARLISALLGA
ncbi:arginase family protein [Actinokineospora iranica]|uniref:Arginase n=1 Tax=Actinokineospora iranica TaxID=1271860 RepID=A0A1G6X0N4_9PSEU|nr:arginase family protein [Actinokineospora iranica]SDD71661.1 arginase [Actinokineospora iranica]